MMKQAYSERNPAPTSDVEVKRAPERKRAPSELQEEAKRKLAGYRRANAS